MITKDFANQIALEAKQQGLRHDAYVVASAIKLAAGEGSLKTTVCVRHELTATDAHNLELSGIHLESSERDSKGIRYTLDISEATE